MTLEFTSAALADAESAVLWYEEQRSGLGSEFREALLATVSAILEFPAAYPVIHRQTRRARLRRFPYSLFYRDSEGSITVVACFHARRNPSAWELR